MAESIPRRREYHSVTFQKFDDDCQVISLMRDLGVSEGDISATTAHSIAVMRAVYSHPLPKEPRGGADAIAAAIAVVKA